ncbi:MAG: GPW/gp25 family protein [Melioribacteraceae bacterium]|nr:GPW/gp25 family protein [Melioribacteraceae bacterium]
MASKFAFVGTGWKFPPVFEKESASVEMLADEKDINSSLEILFSTSVGERIMQPKYGSNLKRLLFDPIDTSLKAYIKNIIKTAILYFEPRINLDDIMIDPKEEEGLIIITLEYTIRNTNSRYNYVYPFYINEGTNIQ